MYIELILNNSILVIPLEVGVLEVSNPFLYLFRTSLHICVRDDVKRHYATIHCKNPERFPCHVIGCPFSGENGFTRKDKLTSHMKSTHKGLPHPGKRLQAIKPKTGVSDAGVRKAGSQT